MDTDGREADDLLVLRLYVSGDDGAHDSAARAGLERLAERLRIETRVDVVDISAEPDRAETDRVLATPTVERVSPAPVLRVIGDLSDLDAAMNGLGLRTWKLEPEGQP